MTRLDSAPAEAFAECTCIDSSRHTVDNHLKRVICSFLAPLKTQLKERILVMANQTAEQETAPVTAEGSKPKYPGIPVTCNGNQLVAQWVETRITEGGVYYPITPSTEGGEIYQQAFAQGALDVWGNQKLAVETEGEHLSLIHI